jgi:ubiquinone/menaquinone biosynthesis C-methylase UbiE
MDTEVQLHFDALALHYDAKYSKPSSLTHYEKIRRMELLQHHAQFLQPKSILDAGCGSGIVLAQLSRRLSDATFVGVDISSQMLQQARAKNLSRVRFQQARLEQLPFSDNSFDLVYALGVMDYVDNPRSFFESVRRVLQPDGHFIFTYPNADSINRIVSMPLRKYSARSRNGVSAVPVKRVTVDRLVTDCDFQLLQRHYITYGNGLISLPWSIGLSRLMERALAHSRIGRHLAWSCICKCAVRKRRGVNDGSRQL